MPLLTSLENLFEHSNGSRKKPSRFYSVSASNIPFRSADVFAGRKYWRRFNLETSLKAIIVMAAHIKGPLYYEQMGRIGPVMAFVHPNPMDQSCWIYQMAHLSTWYRCIAIDLPGYGRSPKAERGLTMNDMAEACWEAINEKLSDEWTILVGCSAGSAIVPYMHLQRPQRARALVLSGTGFTPAKEFAARRIKAYTERGIDYRWGYTFEDLSPAFRATPMAHFFADMFTERNAHADLQSILHLFEALAEPDAEDQHRTPSPTSE